MFCAHCEKPVPASRCESLFCSEECKAEYSKNPPETIACENCSAHIDGLKEAEAAGWKEIEIHVEGFSWNYLGICPDCLEEGYDEAD